MALTIETPDTGGRSEDVIGRRRAAFYTVTFDNDYLEGGEAFDPAALGFQGVVHQVHVSTRPNALGAQASYDRTNKTLVLYGKVDSANYGEVCHCDASTVVADVLVIGE